jgi:hypothetical protein
MGSDKIRQLNESHAPFVNLREVPIGFASCGFSPEEIQEAMARAKSDGPWYTTEEVVRYLESMQPD